MPDKISRFTSHIEGKKERQKCNYMVVSNLVIHIISALWILR